MVQRRISHAIGRKRCRTISARGAFAARPFATFITAPRQLIWHAQFQSASDDCRLVEGRKRRHQPHAIICSNRNRLPDMLQKWNTAICICVARRIIRMRPQIEITVIIFIDALREAGRSGKHQPVAERNICRDFSAIHRPLVTIGGMTDFLRGAVKQRAIGKTHDLREIKLKLANTIVSRNSLSRMKFHTMFLSVEDCERCDIFRADFRNRQRQASCGIDAAARQDNCFLPHGVISIRGGQQRRRGASSQRIRNRFRAWRNSRTDRWKCHRAA